MPKCIRVNLRKKTCSKDWRVKLGRKRVSAGIAGRRNSLIPCAGKEKLRPVDLLPKGYRGVSFRDWLELIVKVSASLSVVNHDSFPRIVCDVLDC
jgi:hypothetical protein